MSEWASLVLLTVLVVCSAVAVTFAVSYYGGAKNGNS